MYILAIIVFVALVAVRKLFFRLVQARLSFFHLSSPRLPRPPYHELHYLPEHLMDTSRFTHLQIDYHPLYASSNTHLHAAGLLSLVLICRYVVEWTFICFFLRSLYCLGVSQSSFLAPSMHRHMYAKSLIEHWFRIAQHRSGHRTRVGVVDLCLDDSCLNWMSSYSLPHKASAGLGRKGMGGIFYDV